MDRPLYSYQYAAVSFDDAVEVLVDDAPAILRDATRRSTDHATEVAATLHADLGTVEVDREVDIEVGDLEPVEMLRARLPLRWQAARGAHLFPTLDAHLEVLSLSRRPPRTQVSLVGTYRPPLGVVGAAADAMVGHRVAESVAKHFVEHVVARLEERVPADA